ncbi:MAG: hypothetical protein HFI47_08740 [Lachnospiraceae bacterium]|nr:hypothetical protein [Lachnospiraceae bacterium]
MKNKEINVTVEFTEGAEDRITEAFLDLYYAIKSGRHKGPLLDNEQEKEAPA